jgi:hypothetical protein
MRTSWAFLSCFRLGFQDNAHLKNIPLLHRLCKGRTINCLIAFWPHYLVVPSFYVGLPNTVDGITPYHVVKALLLVGKHTETDNGRKSGSYIPRGAEQCGNWYRITQRIHDIDSIVFDSFHRERVARFKQLSSRYTRFAGIQKSNAKNKRIRTLITIDIECKDQRIQGH